MTKYLKIWILIYFLYACKQQDSSIQAPASDIGYVLTKAQLRQAGVLLGTTTFLGIANTIQVNGIIDVPPQNLASVSAPMGGYVKSTAVLSGMHVHQGDVLATLYHQSYIQLQQDYMLAYNQWEMTEKEYKRQQELQVQNIGSVKDFQTIQATYRSAVATLKALRARLKLLHISPEKLMEGDISSTITIRSPINGNVKSVNVSVGKFVNDMDVMYEIVDNSHMHLELKVFEKDILNIKKNQKIIFTVPSTGSTTYEGSVYLVGKNFDTNTKSILVHGHLDNEDKEHLIPGMFVDAAIIGEKRTVAALPEDAFVLDGTVYYIFVKSKEDNQTISFEKVPVHIGGRDKNFIEFWPKEATLTSKSIVVKGAYFINSITRNEDE